MVTQVRFLGKVFWHFDFWTFFLSIFRNPKKLCPKKCEKTALPFCNFLKNKKNIPIIIHANMKKPLNNTCCSQIYIIFKKQLKDNIEIYIGC
jgi:hypothetical protein